jgi:hypothetical protein
VETHNRTWIFRARTLSRRRCANLTRRSSVRGPGARAAELPRSAWAESLIVMRSTGLVGLLLLSLFAGGCSSRKPEIRFLAIPDSECSRRCRSELDACMQSCAAQVSNADFTRCYDGCRQGENRCGEQCPGAQWGTLEELEAKGQPSE